MNKVGEITVLVMAMAPVALRAVGFTMTDLVKLFFTLMNPRLDGQGLLASVITYSGRPTTKKNGSSSRLETALSP